MSWRSFPAAASLVLLAAPCGGDSADPTDPPPAPTVSSTVAGTVTASETPATSVGGPSTTPAATSEPPATTTPSSTSTTLGAPEAVTVEVNVSDGEVSGPGRVMVPRGSSIRLTVTSDEADEVHFHGYDLFADVAPGQPAIMLVVATIPGVFEVELEGAGLELVLVEVA